MVESKNHLQQTKEDGYLMIFGVLWVPVKILFKKKSTNFQAANGWTSRMTHTHSNLGGVQSGWEKSSVNDVNV